MLFIIGERRPTQTIRVLLILIGYLYINVVKVFFVSGIDGESESLGVAKGSGQDGLMGGTKEATIHLEGTEGEVDCEVCGVPQDGDNEWSVGEPRNMTGTRPTPEADKVEPQATQT